MFKLSFLSLLYISFTIFSCTSETSKAVTDKKIPFYSTSDSIIYRNAAEEFLVFVREDIKDDAILLGSKPIPDLGFCLEYVLQDTLTFKPEEIERIDEINTNPIFSNWYDISLGETNIADRDTIVAIIKDEARGWPYLYEKLGEEYYDFSMPVFIRDYNYCLFYMGYQCGPLCGSGQLNLYKKEDGKWKFVSTYCTSIS